MSTLRAHCLSISLDGYGAGPDQDVDNPLGVGGTALHNWMIPTRSFQELEGSGIGESGVDDDFVARGFANIGAWIMGRNMLELGYQCTEHVATANATHFVLESGMRELNHLAASSRRARRV
jgi:hypothetical protein